MKRDIKDNISYVVLAIFVIFGFISIISIPGIFIVSAMELDSTANNYLSEKIIFFIFFVSIFFGVPVISTVIQFFLNKELFILQLIFILFPMIVMIVFVINT